MDPQVVIQEQSLVKPPPSTPSTTLFIHTLEQQLFFPVEMLFSYKVDPSRASSTQHVARNVREALEKLLVPYYFAAGRMRVNEDQQRIELECNGAGVIFAAASCAASITDAGDLRKVLPSARKFLAFPHQVPEELSDAPLLAIQVTRFQCGGFIVGITAAHAIFDGTAGCDFYDSLARVTRGDLTPLATKVSTDRTIFRCRDPPQPTMDHPEFLAMPDVPARMLFSPAQYHPSDSLIPGVAFKLLSFSPAALNNLKAKAMEEDAVTRCSSFEALAAHIWQAHTKASFMDDTGVSEPEKVAKLFVVVNVRHRVADLPQGFVGNVIVAAPSLDATVGEVCTKSLSFCVSKVQAAIRLGSKSDEYMHSAINWCENKNGQLDLPGGLIITPWSKLHFHKIDFGWGVPEFVAPAVQDRKEYVVVLSNCNGDGGVDVFIGMEFEKLAKLEQFLKIC